MSLITDECLPIGHGDELHQTFQRQHEPKMSIRPVVSFKTSSTGTTKGKEEDCDSIYIQSWDKLYLYIVKNANCHFCYLSNVPAGVRWRNMVVNKRCFFWLSYLHMLETKTKGPKRWMIWMLFFFFLPNLLSPADARLCMSRRPLSQRGITILTPHWRHQRLSCPSCCVRLTAEELQPCTRLHQKA